MYRQPVFHRKALLLFSILLLFSSELLHAQSISGRVRSELSEKHLGYATVRIYRDGELVKNVLTDPSGDFHVDLDTGTYRCEIHYAGHKTSEQTLKVTRDEKADFELHEDRGSEFEASEILKSRSESKSRYSSGSGGAHRRTRTMSEAGRYSGTSSGPPAFIDPMWGKGETADSALAGKLTAGEINDFSDWDLWSDLNKGELKSYRSIWEFAPSERYSVQLKGRNGLPVSNAKVILRDAGKVIYSARTDNTGKAELWGGLSPGSSPLRSPNIEAVHQGTQKWIVEPKAIENGVNSLRIGTGCNRPKGVDIAIVTDATGSMGDEIAHLKSDLNRVIRQSKRISDSLELRFANVFYRDHGDEYLVREQNFTGILSEAVGFIDRQEAKAGGDKPEAVEVALDSAINGLDWRKEARARVLFLVLDASPHNNGSIREKLRKLSRTAARKGIRIVPVAGSGTRKNTEYLMRCLSLSTNGTYTYLTDHSGIGGDHIEPSTDDHSVEHLNQLLVRILKSYTYMPDCRQQLPELGVHLPDSQVVAPQTPDTSSIAEEDSIRVQWKYYPNPTRGRVHIVANHRIERLYISDLSGKVVETIEDIRPSATVTADLSAYASGLYLIRYRIGKKWVSGKVKLEA